MKSNIVLLLCLVSLLSCKKKSNNTQTPVTYPNKVILTYDGQSHTVVGHKGHVPNTIDPAVINAYFNPGKYPDHPGNNSFEILVNSMNTDIGFKLDAFCSTDDTMILGRHKIVIATSYDIILDLNNSTSTNKKYFVDSGYFTLNSCSDKHYDGSLELYMNNYLESKKITCDFTIDEPDLP